MTPQDKIEISLRAAMLAKRVLDLVNPTSRVVASLVLKDAIKQLGELAEKVDKLPGD